MVAQITSDIMKKFSFLRGLDDTELIKVATLCSEHHYATGEICQTEGQPTKHINLITKGRVGVIMHVPNITYCSSEIIMDTFHENEVFGWSALLQGTPWSTLRVLEPTDVLFIQVDDILELCEANHHVGYIMMRNLASLVASRFRRNRMSILNAIVAIRGE
jgi:CRP/FNR family cyclic AMP-dependent transcriptional regulator